MATRFVLVTPNWKILYSFLPEYYHCSVIGVLGQCFSSVRAVFPTKGHNLRSDLQRDDQNFKEGGCQKVEHQPPLLTMNCFSFC